MFGIFRDRISALAQIPWQLALVILSLALGLGIRLSNWAWVIGTGDHFNFDPDSYYQLRRLAYFLQNFPSPLAFDPLMDWPQGAAVDWPDGYIWILGLPLKLLGVSNLAELEKYCCGLMIGLGLLTAFATYFLAKKIFQHPGWALLVLLLASTNFLLVRFSYLGEVDHHVVEVLLVPLTAIAVIRLSENISFINSLLLSLITFVGIANSSSFLITLGAASLALFFYVPQNKKLLPFISGQLIGLFLILLYALWNLHHRFTWWDIRFPTFAHLAAVCAFAGTLALAFKFDCRKRIILLAGIALLAGVISLGDRHYIFPHLRVAYDYIFEKVGVLSNIPEAHALFFSRGAWAPDFAYYNFGFLVYLLPTAWVALWFFRKESLAIRISILMLACLSLPALSQKRFAHFAVPLFVVYLSILARAIWRSPLAQRMRVAKVAPLAVAALTLWPYLLYEFPEGGSARALIDSDVSKNLATLLHVSPAQTWQALGQTTAPQGDEAIWAPPNMGHQLLYVTGKPVISNGFNHQYALDYDYRIRTVSAPEQLVTLLKTLRVGTLIVANDIRYLALLTRLNGRDESMAKELEKASAWYSVLRDSSSIDGVNFAVERRYPYQAHYTHIKIGLVP